VRVSSPPERFRGGGATWLRPAFGAALKFPVIFAEQGKQPNYFPVSGGSNSLFPWDARPARLGLQLA